MWALIPIIFVIIHLCNTTTGQLFYPDDPLLQNRQAHQQYYEDAISKGIRNITLFTNVFLSTFYSQEERAVFGPVSITGALALLLLGSGGTTFNEIANVMGLNFQTQTEYSNIHQEISKVFSKLVNTIGFNLNQQIFFANGLFIQSTFPVRTSYRETSKLLYKSEVLNLNFERDPLQAQTIINQWVYEKTNGKISTLLNLPPPPSTKLLITSVLYFKAPWEQPFIKGLTKWKPFYNNGKSKKSDYLVEFMTAGGYYPYFHGDNYQVLGLPYKGNKTTMYVVIPHNSTQDKLLQLQNSFIIENMGKVVGNMKTVECAILFPKMELENSIDLSAILYNMGLRSVFNPYAANLTLIASDGYQPPSNPSTWTTDTRPQGITNSALYVDKVFHKVYMNITETGTEAAAATGISLTRSGDEKVIVRVDVPFLFFILHEETQMILFWGTIKVPTPNLPNP